MRQVWDENLGSLADCTSVLIGDTIATGTTLVGVLDHVLKVMEENDNPRDIHIFTIAGSYACEPGLEKVLALPTPPPRCTSWLCPR
jgi:hypothetical protein